MSYEISFTKRLQVPDSDIYINDCCWGGDLVRNLLLPLVPQVAPDADHIQSVQEDWGWFIWFRRGETHFEINIWCDDPTRGEFRIHLIAKRRAGLFRKQISETSKLDNLRELVCAEITKWASTCRCEEIKE
ncbi:MAG: hypothetical protein M1453_02370 [Acidobacteria bacterium]|nr:hypothetical protein [Acidobacteriota bacterium]MCL5286829.1 hypothetical protein [Acidobacteriota bacterium]